MITAFGVVATVTMLGGASAWWMFQRVEDQVATITGHVVPAMSTAEALAQEASGVANATAGLAVVVNEEQRASLMTVLTGRIGSLHARLDELENYRTEAGLLADLRDRVRTLSANLDRESDFVARRIAVRTRLRADAIALREGHHLFLEGVQPHIDGTYRTLFKGVNTLVADISTGMPGRGTETQSPESRLREMNAGLVLLQRRVSQLFTSNVGEMLTLLQLAAAVNLSAGLLNETILAENSDQVQQLRTRFTQITIAMGTIRLNLPVSEPNQHLLALTMPLLRFGLGADNLFDLRLKELQLQDSSSRVVDENKRLTDSLGAAVRQLLVSAKTTAEHAAASVQDTTAYAKALQTAVAGLAVLTALLMGWSYVGREIIGRILALRQAMEAEAQGRAMVIPVGGNDEIGDMAQALERFVVRRKQAEAELRAAKDQAEDAFRELKEVQASLVQAEKMTALTGLVAGIAHELNTPVGVCITASTLLSDRTEALARAFGQGQLRRSQVEDFVAIVSEVSALLHHNLNRTSTLVQLFKQVAVDPSPDSRRRFGLAEQLHAVTAALGERMRERGITLTLTCSPRLWLDSYPEALRQVVESLMANVIDHAFPEGGTGQAWLQAQMEPGGQVAIILRDNGCGIPPALQEKIFDPFFTTRRTGGSIGLGLHVAYNLVSGLLGGRIALDSSPGQGSSFTLLVPTNAPLHRGSHSASGGEGAPLPVQAMT